MYVTHDFANVDTLQRVHQWLLRLGFPPEDIEIDKGDEPRLAVKTRLASADRIQMIIDAIETSDPKGAPSLWDLALQPHPHREPPPPPKPQVEKPSPIGWHPSPDDARDDPEARKVSEGLEKLDIEE
jgi:hypothetical protein